MREHSRLEEEPLSGRARHGTPEAGDPASPTEAILDMTGRMPRSGRGVASSVAGAIDGLHASAGNGAVARLLEGAATRHREGPGRVSAARSGPTVLPVVQRSDDDGPAPAEEATTASDSGLSSLGTGAPPHGPSWTHVGPSTPSSYTVSGSLRDVANAVAARTEAGSVTATPSSDTETWTPDGGTEQIIAARVTIDQVVELPTWSDKSSATAKQQAEWDRFHSAITTHEAGHVSTDKASFAGAHARMVGKAPTDGDTALDSVAAKATTDNDAYDGSTNHGLTQGTGINPNIDEVTKVP